MDGFVIITDATDRENEADLVLAAEHATEERLAFMIRETSGILCVPMGPEEVARIGIPPMSQVNTDRHGTGWLLSLDAKGTTTGVSAVDRLATITTLLNPTSKLSDFTMPGHMYPLSESSGGLASRQGHTEASLALARRAGLRPVTVIGELMHADGTMLRGENLTVFSERHGIPIITVESLQLTTSH